MNLIPALFAGSIILTFTDQDIPMFDNAARTAINQLAIEKNIEPEALLAIAEVESAGRIFAKINGRNEPLIRFEGHYFYRLLPTAKRNIAVTRGLASSSAGRIKNPYTQAARWRLLKKCEAIDRDAALQSVSWGIGQVMAIHWRWLGYASVDALVAAVRSGVEGQVALMLRYIEKAKLTEFIEQHDWAAFARAYNGPAYKRLGYHLKITEAYQKHCAASGSAIQTLVSARRNALATLKIGNHDNGVRQLQQDLSQLGYPIKIDGDFGPVTRRMVMAFQKAKRLTIDGIVGPKTFEVVARDLPQPANLVET